MKPIDNKKVNTELYFVNFGVKTKMCIALPLPPLQYLNSAAFTITLATNENA